MRRFVNRVFAVVALLGVLGLGIAAPEPVHAVDTETGLILAGVAAAAWVVMVVVATTLIYKHGYAPPTNIPTTSHVDAPFEEPGVRIANGCKQAGTGLTLVCW